MICLLFASDDVITGKHSTVATLCYMGTQFPLLQRERAPPPQFSACICCGQMAAWINMPLGMEVGLSPGDFVLEGDPAPSPKRGGATLPKFRLIFIMAKRLDASRCHLIGMAAGLSSGDLICVRWVPSPLPN